MGRQYWLGLLTACSLLSVVKPIAALDQEEHWQQTMQRAYNQSVEDAAVAEISEFVPLTPIVPNNDQLTWREIDGEPHVLVVTWTSWDGYDSLVGTSTTLGREIWTTPAPQVQQFVAEIQPDPDILALRLEQYLGLPPNNGKTKWVELWVKPEDLFRPCPDIDVTDTQCDLSFPATATPEHRVWFVNLYLSSYGDRGYPWTRLGYTYDWGAVDTEVGANELVVRAGATVLIEGVTENLDYFSLPTE